VNSKKRELMDLPAPTQQSQPVKSVFARALQPVAAFDVPHGTFTC
jgi:hypothetical protein